MTNAASTSRTQSEATFPELATAIRQGRFGLVLDTAAGLLYESRQKGDAEAQLRCSYYIGLVNLMLGQSRETVAVYEQALATQTKDESTRSVVMAAVLHAIGQLQRHRGSYFRLAELELQVASRGPGLIQIVDAVRKTVQHLGLPTQQRSAVRPTTSIPGVSADIVQDLELGLYCLETALVGEDASVEVIVGPECRWVRVRAKDKPGVQVDLSRRNSLRRILNALVEHDARAREGHLTASALFLLAWPGVYVQREAAMNRIRVAIATLRKLGLQDVVETFPDGYGLNARAAIQFASDTTQLALNATTATMGQ